VFTFADDADVVSLRDARTARMIREAWSAGMRRDLERYNFRE
jgi:hypothetical protein